MPKKSLGQNFLINTKVAYDMVASADISNKDVVLEIGPGKGVLTKYLLEKAGVIYAIEKDDILIPILEEKFVNEIKNGKLVLIHGDILNFNPKDIGLESGKYKIVANIPYYITGEIIRKFLESEEQPANISFLVQKEVAERIVAKDNKESILSISVKAYGEPKYERTVKAGHFFPKPKVDSAILSIKNISKDFFKDLNEKKFFEILKTGFLHKRKVLISNLSIFAKREKLEEIFNKLNLKLTTRAEDVDLINWKEIVKIIG